MPDLSTQLSRFLTQLMRWPAAFAGDALSLTTNTTQAVNGATVETDLMVYSLPAGTLAVNGQKLRITGAGTFAANGNTKTIRIRFGGTIVSTRATTASGGAWTIQAVVVRTGAATQKAFGTQFESGNGGQTTYTTPAETLSGAIDVKLTGQSGTASSDVVGEIFTVEWLA